MGLVDKTFCEKQTATNNYLMVLWEAQDILDRWILEKGQKLDFDNRLAALKMAARSKWQNVPQDMNQEVPNMKRAFEQIKKEIPDVEPVKFLHDSLNDFGSVSVELGSPSNTAFDWFCLRSFVQKCEYKEMINNIYQNTLWHYIQDVFKEFSIPRHEAHRFVATFYNPQLDLLNNAYLLKLKIQEELSGATFI